MGNYNSVDLTRRFTNGQTASGAIARNDTTFHATDWAGEMARARRAGATDADLEYNTRLFAFLAAEGRALGYGDGVPDRVLQVPARSPNRGTQPTPSAATEV